MPTKQCIVTVVMVLAAMAGCGDGQIAPVDSTADGNFGTIDQSITMPDAVADSPMGSDGAAPDGTATDAALDAAAPDAAAPDAAAPDAAAPDAAAPDAEPCSTEPCDLLEQCGCASNQACDTTFQVSGLTVCRPITSAGTELSPCSHSTQCAAGYLCLGGGRWSRCKKFCGQQSDCHGTDRSRCFSILASGTPIPDTNYCTANCDPLAATPAGCPAGWQCFALYNGSTRQGYTDCASPGPVGIGGACSDASDCAKDLTCVFFNTAGQCLPECRKSPAGGCSGRRTCYSYAPKVVLAGIEYGYCY